MSERRVVVTGVGPVTPIGIGKEAYWEAALAGKTGTIALSYFPWHDKHRLSSQVCAPLVGFDPHDPEIQKKYNFKTREHIDRSTSIMQAGAFLAIKDAGFDITKISDGGEREPDKHALGGVDSRRLSTIFGAGIGGFF